MTEISGLPARRAALKLLDAVLRRGETLEQALNSATQGMDNPADRAFAHAIASETLRHLPDLDDLIDSATKQRMPDDAKARMVLRLALTQTLALGTPPHAAIATALPLLEGGPKKLVHGVFGTLSRGGVQLRSIPMLPAEVEVRWTKSWGTEMLANARKAMALPPSLDLMLRNPQETDKWTAELQGISLASGHVRVSADAKLTELPGFTGGAWWVQNIAATIPVRLLGKGQGRTVLDLCAAPGGKTMQLAAAGWSVTALDNNATRIVRVAENLARTGLRATLVTADALLWEPSVRYDAILLDAPCTASGIFARHPDVLHRVRPRDIMAMAKLQMTLLARAATWLKPGGTLIYATCSLEPEEGEAIVAATPDLKLDLILNNELPKCILHQGKSVVRIFPSPGIDGFFIARMSAS